MNTQFEEGCRYFNESFMSAYAYTVNCEALNAQFQLIVNQQEKIMQIVDTLLDLAFEKRNLGDAQRQGYLFEAYQRESYNYVLIKNGQSIKPAFTPSSQEYASPDVIADGVSYNAKVYADAHKTFRAVSVTNQCEYNKLRATVSEEQFKAERGISGKMGELKYKGQKPLVVQDQRQEVVNNARSAAKASVNKRTQAEKNFREIQRNTTDHIEDRCGNQSNPISKSRLEELDRLSINKELNPETIKAFGFDPAESLCLADIKAKLMQKALKTGTTSLTIAAVLNLVPIIINAFSLLSEKGELDVEDFCELGYQALSVPVKGFIIGCTSAAIINGINYHRLLNLINGAQASPIGFSASFIAMGVSVLLGTIEIVIKSALGKQSNLQIAEEITDLCVTSLFSIAGGMVSQKVLSTIIQTAVQEAVDKTITAIAAKVFGTAAATVLPAFNVISYMAGAIVGFGISKLLMFSSKRIYLSFCVESGFTLFGLVDQKYELPMEIMKQIGAEVFEYEKFEYETFQTDAFRPECFELSDSRFEYDIFGITTLRRGVIGFGKIGYITD